VLASIAQPIAGSVAAGWGVKGHLEHSTESGILAQLFSPAMTLFARVLLVGGPMLAISAGVALGYASTWSDWASGGWQPVEQPIQFSHEHHVGGLGIDCRYCHTGVEKSAVAGVPPTQTCITCHSQMWTHAPLLEPVRESWATGKPLQWNRVHDLPDYVYFDHSIHVAKGVGCSTCHGDVASMPLMERAASLQMRWCLDCHREPEKYLRPREEIYNTKWKAPADQLARGRELLAAYHVQKSQLTNCSVCHR
jgi:hypothetical protein